MHSNLKVSDNIYNMEPGTFRVYWYETDTWGGYAVSPEGVCVRIHRNYKLKRTARNVLKAFAGK